MLVLSLFSPFKVQFQLTERCSSKWGWGVFPLQRAQSRRPLMDRPDVIVNHFQPDRIWNQLARTLTTAKKKQTDRQTISMPHGVSSTLTAPPRALCGETLVLLSVQMVDS